MNDMRLERRECGRLIVLSATQQAAIIAELKSPAQCKFIECACGRFQLALSAAPIRRRERAEVP